jgi:hypothetical protein
MTKKEIADKFAKDHGINVVYCESCEDWFCQCPHCHSVICCYQKMCCYACFKTYQPMLDKLMS